MATFRYNNPTQNGYGILHHKSNQFIQKGQGLGSLNALFKKGAPFTQRGGGLGSFFRGIFNFLKPVVSSGVKTLTSVGKKVIASPIVKDLVQTAKKEGMKTGIQVIGNILEGKSAKEPIEDGLKRARDHLATTIRKLDPDEHEQDIEQQGSGRKRKKKSTNKKSKLQKLGKEFQDIFTI
jgi:hypothetical protein